MLTVPPELDQVLSDYASEFRKPVATAIIELLEGTVPQLRALTDLQRAVNAGQLDLAASLSRKLFGDSILPAAAAQHELEGLIASATPEKQAAIQEEVKKRVGKGAKAK
jgi:hypothetical protein